MPEENLEHQRFDSVIIRKQLITIKNVASAIYYYCLRPEIFERLEFNREVIEINLSFLEVKLT